MLRYPVAIRELDQSEGGGFLSEIPDLPGCMADGETIEEAVRNVNDAAAEWIAAAQKLERQIPTGRKLTGNETEIKRRLMRITPVKSCDI